MPDSEAIYLDEIIDKALAVCAKLPQEYSQQRGIIEDCKNRLGHGALHLAVMGMFKRGKSSFVNTLLGMDILPTSVIPVTSIPTTIKFGKELSCTVRFFNKKPDLVVHDSVPEINALLQAHVAEENNPVNRLCVDEAIVECPNSFLENGTLLIDTPGFGSTYTHNTKTTVDLLQKCDAVLFLLSSDPPFTQTEVEFLKEVRKSIPRIFFILNKIDLLTVDELNKIDLFIKGILVNNLGFPSETQVFHVSAKMGQTLIDIPENNPAWRLSGMAAIKTEILDFMVREKYFTLSQTLIEKLKSALAAVLSHLETDYRECMGPVAQAKKEHDWIVHHSGSIQKKIEKERQLIDVEIKAFHEFVDKTIDPKKGEIQQKARDSLHSILAITPLKKTSLARTVRAAFEQHCDEMFSHLFLQVAGAVNKPFKKAHDLHTSEFQRLVEEIRKSVPSVSFIDKETMAIGEELEISPDPRWRLEGVAIAFDQIKLPFCGFLASKQVKLLRYEDCFAMAITEIINRNIMRLSIRIKDLINDSCKELKKSLDERFNELVSSMHSVMQEKKASMEDFEATMKPRSQQMEDQKNEVSQILGMLA
jgi:Dynamin family.